MSTHHGRGLEFDLVRVVLMSPLSGLGDGCRPPVRKKQSIGEGGLRRDLGQKTSVLLEMSV